MVCLGKGEQLIVCLGKGGQLMVRLGKEGYSNFISSNSIIILTYFSGGESEVERVHFAIVLRCYRPHEIHVHYITLYTKNTLVLNQWLY